MSDTGRIQEEAELYTAEGRIEVAAIFPPLVFIFLFLGKVEVADTFPLLIYVYYFLFRLFTNWRQHWHVSAKVYILKHENKHKNVNR